MGRYEIALKKPVHNCKNCGRCLVLKDKNDKENKEGITSGWNHIQRIKRLCKNCNNFKLNHWIPTDDPEVTELFKEIEKIKIPPPSGLYLTEPFKIENLVG